MDKKNFIRIINEEIKNFDFLNNDEQLKEQEGIDLLTNEDLQKQFICDSLLDRNNKLKNIHVDTAKISGNWNDQDFDSADKISIEYSATIGYTYDSNEEPLEFTIKFNGDNIGIEVAGSNDTGDYYTPPAKDSWFKSINWYDINVSLFTKDGEEVEFLAFEHAPENIQVLFIREFLESFISTQTSMEVLDKSNKAAVTQFC